jgi:hypothetical protein
MQHPLQLPRLACTITPLQPIYFTSSYALPNVAPLDPIFLFYLCFSLFSILNLHKPSGEMLVHYKELIYP